MLAPENHAAQDDTLFDDPLEWVLFSQACDEEPALEGVWQSQLMVEGMHCAACADTVERTLYVLPGVQSVRVSAATRRASVTWSASQTKPSSWMAASQSRGYQLTPAYDGIESRSLNKESRLGLWRWLVSGFCMMQVMMYATPSYFAKPGEISADIVGLLRWASWVLCLPVILFSCSPFFKNAFRDIRRGSVSMDLPVAIGIVITFSISTAATFDSAGWWGEMVYFDSLTMFVFFLLTGRWLELRLRERTAGALGQLMQRLPQRVDRLLGDGAFEQVAVRQLQVGDVIRVLPGQAFPADGFITLGETFADEALLTGESRPIARLLGAPVIAGSFNTANPVQVKISQIGKTTRYAQIIALMEHAALDKPQLVLLADRIARPFLWGVLITAAGAAAYWWSTDPARGLMAAVAVLVVTCPCALSLATPAAMLTTAGWLAKRGVLVRRLQALQALAAVDTVVFDKTGTLTEPAMELVHTETRPDINKNQALRLATALCQNSLHPVSRAITSASLGQSIEKLAMRDVQEIPGYGLLGNIENPHDLGLVNPLRLGSAQFCGLEESQCTNQHVFLADGNGYLAQFELSEKLRSGTKQTIERLTAMGLGISILSGDRQMAVDKLAMQLNIVDAFGACTPSFKLAQLQSLQGAGRTVMMVGDGLNDGPVLAQADVSVALGAAVPLAQAQSDFVMPEGQIHMLPNMLEQAKKTMRIIKQNLWWAALYNAIGVPMALTGWLPAWLAGLGMAASSLVVLGNAARLVKGAGDY